MSAARVRGAGLAEPGTTGKNPSTSVWFSSSRVSSVRMPPPKRFEPRPATAMGKVDALASLSMASLAWRHAYVSAESCQRSTCLPAGLDLLFHQIGEREVHVVAA